MWVSWLLSTGRPLLEKCITMYYCVLHSSALTLCLLPCTNRVNWVIGQWLDGFCDWFFMGGWRGLSSLSHKKDSRLIEYRNRAAQGIKYSSPAWGQSGPTLQDLTSSQIQNRLRGLPLLTGHSVDSSLSLSNHSRSIKNMENIFRYYWHIISS